ncbi:CinA family protein [Methylophilus medardicus]|uniref:CinA family protein n=1 Tax=Methylophilus medardicus TaxID=2588534 RepID=A0A5B8CR32_9PROT|nr:CinA family protein [Methylophilus medardicus]QDC43722.1 CinA family protein [Methylophilus medardicus]QDC48729.1 CinA family protein [Methylophilus medardicus]QDC52434.1 CinA family protein [Methylophilus medardicus]
MQTMIELSAILGEALAAKGWQLALAESCTGGMVAQVVTAVAGSSVWFDRGFVTYSNAAKTDMLGVQADLIATYGAVSEPVAHAMAHGALQYSLAQISGAITGIAGPAGGSPDKPVGTVCFAWAIRHEVQGIHVVAETMYFQGDRTNIREQAASHLLAGLLRLSTS